MSSKDKTDAAATYIDVQQLAAHMRQQFPPGEQHDAAVQACIQAEATVLMYLRRADLSRIPGYAIPALQRVMLQIAERIFRAPVSERSSFNAGEISMSLLPARFMTSDEQAALKQYRRLRATTGETGGGVNTLSSVTPCMPSTGLPLGVIAVDAPCGPWTVR